MTINFKEKTLQEYLDQLSRREPVPGGGSAAALTGGHGRWFDLHGHELFYRQKIQHPNRGQALS